MTSEKLLDEVLKNEILCGINKFIYFEEFGESETINRVYNNFNFRDLVELK